MPYTQKGGSEAQTNLRKSWLGGTERNCSSPCPTRGSNPGYKIATVTIELHPPVIPVSMTLALCWGHKDVKKVMMRFCIFLVSSDPTESNMFYINCRMWGQGHTQSAVHPFGIIFLREIIDAFWDLTETLMLVFSLTLFTLSKIFKTLHDDGVRWAWHIHIICFWEPRPIFKVRGEFEGEKKENFVLNVSWPSLIFVLAYVNCMVLYWYDSTHLYKL